MASTTNRDIIALLECPVCCDLITPPAYQCQNGHTVCTRCYQEVSSRNQKCPVCRVPLPQPGAGIRSLIIDNLGDVEISCRNARCTAKVKVRDMKSHLAGCVFSSNGDDESINGRINDLFNERARGRNQERGNGQAQAGSRRGNGQAQGSRRGTAADGSTRQRTAASTQVPTHQAQPPDTTGLSNSNARPTQQAQPPDTTGLSNSNARPTQQAQPPDTTELSNSNARPTHQAQPPDTTGLSNSNARPTQQNASPLPSSQIHGTSCHRSNPTVIIIQAEGRQESTENSSRSNPPPPPSVPASRSRPSRGLLRNCTTQCCTVLTIPILIILVAVILVAATIGGFVVGAKNWVDCPASSQIPVTLCLGCLTLTIEATLYACGCRSKKFVVPALFIYIIILAFSVFDVLSIVTTVQFNDSSLDSFCAPNVYIYSFIYNIFVVIAAIGLPFGYAIYF